MKILIIAPHMDDEVLGCGGTIVRHVQEGDEVHVALVARRAYDHKYDDSAIAQEEADTESARKILGYQRAYFLRLDDEQLDDLQIRVIVPLEELLQEIRPETVYLPHRGDSNQDHKAVFAAAMIACRPLSEHRPSRVLCYEVPSSTDQAPPFPDYAFMPNYYVDISETVDKKVEAMEAYERELRAFPHPRSGEGLRIYGKKRGMEMGVEAAEAFMILRDHWPAS